MQVLEGLNDGVVVYMNQPLAVDVAGQFEVKGGRLTGSSVFYIPTEWKFGRRPSIVAGRPMAIVLHTTGVLASNRDLKSLNRLVTAAQDGIEEADGVIEALRTKCYDVGYIPDAVSLTLQNAAKTRKASWCLLIGCQPLPTGELPVVQYSPDLNTCGTWHAGTPKPLAAARKIFKDKPFYTTRGDCRWTGRDYAWPVLEYPDGSSDVIRNVNPYVIGIETMNLGLYGAVMQLRYPGLPKVKVGRYTYEAPSQLMVQTLSNVIQALRAKYGDIPVWGHRDLTPSKIDPWPAMPTQF